MVDKKIAHRLSNRRCVVGTIHSAACLKAALFIRPQALDFFEIRIDSFIGREEHLLRQLPKLKLPLIVTVRDHAEGGACPLTNAKRREYYGRFLPYAAMVDVELRSASSLGDVISNAQKRGIKIILSYHNFQKTPKLQALSQLADKARRAGADIFKVAVTISSPADFATLLLFQAKAKMPLSVMGMGSYGKISRLVFAQSGSALNYGYLGSAQVPGQWPALLLKQRVEELMAA